MSASPQSPAQGIARGHFSNRKELRASSRDMLTCGRSPALYADFTKVGSCARACPVARREARQGREYMCCMNPTMPYIFPIPIRKRRARALAKPSPPATQPRCPARTCSAARAARGPRTPRRVGRPRGAGGATPHAQGRASARAMQDERPTGTLVALMLHLCSFRTLLVLLWCNAGTTPVLCTTTTTTTTLHWRCLALTL